MIDNKVRIHYDETTARNDDLSNWNASYECGYRDGYYYGHTDFISNLPLQIERFREDGIAESRRRSWHWRPYIMGVRDGHGDRRDGVVIRGVR